MTHDLCALCGVCGTCSTAVLGEWSDRGGADPFSRMQKHVILAAQYPFEFGYKLYEELLDIVTLASPAANRCGDALVFPHLCAELPDDVVPVVRCAAMYVKAHRDQVPHNVNAATFNWTCDATIVTYARHLVAAGRIDEAVHIMGSVKDADLITRELANFMHFVRALYRLAVVAGASHERGGVAQIGDDAGRRTFVESLQREIQHVHPDLMAKIPHTAVQSLLGLTEAQFTVGADHEWLPTPAIPDTLTDSVARFDWSRAQALQWYHLLEGGAVDSVAAGSALLRRLCTEAAAAGVESVTLQKHFAMQLLLYGVPECDQPPLMNRDFDDPEDPDLTDAVQFLEAEYSGWCAYVTTYFAHRQFHSGLLAASDHLTKATARFQASVALRSTHAPQPLCVTVCLLAPWMWMRDASV